MLGLALAGVLSVMATPVAAATLFVFGDSLVDTGNADAALRAQGQPTRTPAAAGYFQNRFSNGYNFADVVSMNMGQGPSKAFGYPVAPYTYFYGGTNFSYGGAQTRDEGHGTPGHSPSFQDQLALFAASGKTIAPDDYVLITFGGNDIQQELLKKLANPAYVPDFSATNLALQNGIAALVGAGARNIVVTGEADVGQIPRITQLGSPALDALGSSLSETLNDSFRARTQAAAAATKLNIQFFDLLAFERDLLSNAAANGFTNTTDPCLNEATGQLANPTCDGYLYFDRIHPTDDAHRLIGNAISAQINGVPEIATWAMMILGMGAIGFVLRRAVRRSEIAFDAKIKRIAEGLEG
ncbi:MAG: SGNH/GDSL hydrolase family protein [Sphingomonas taxi]